MLVRSGSCVFFRALSRASSLPHWIGERHRSPVGASLLAMAAPRLQGLTPNAPPPAVPWCTDAAAHRIRHGWRRFPRLCRP
ncbi:hypothetical protein C9I49_17245 [Pseudomonas prosekii]|uniref:Uncharacterized protein n=1 Tax=Pseudomonas prosekii TaxID=1148509 RepID=A0A2U2D5Q7_9PSED|nr:hypothetical protein C9I49_17245 [Pseudomonas prosekii]